jgi:perosamine synthetase
MIKRLPLSEPVISGNEWKYVKECLDTGWVSSAGEFVERIEKKFAEYIGAEYAIPVTNGTSALHISLIVLGIQPDEEVITPSLTFIASSNVIRYCNAYPVFMDVDDTLCMDVEKTVEFIEKECNYSNNSLVNKSTGRIVKGILPVHLYGHPVDMDTLIEVAQKYNLFILEDATEALGSKYKGKMIGKLSDVSAFSFNGNKIITTGGGGMVVTDNKYIADKVRHLTTQARCDKIEYIHDEVGYNYRLTNIQAALGLAQLERLDDFITIKRHIAKFYQNHLNKIAGLKVCCEKEWAFSNYWLSWLLIDESFGKNRKEVIDYLNKKNIQARPFFIPLHNLKPYRNFQTYKMELSDKLYNIGINIPSHVELTDEDLNRVIDAINEIRRK